MTGSNNRRALLIIMAKRPDAGAVKTRLCPPFSHEQALSLYTAFLLDTIGMVDRACVGETVTPALAYAPHDAHDYFRQLVPDRFVLLPQQGSDLGERLCNLPSQARELGYRRVAMISSDSPTLPASVAARCFEELSRPGVDVALGPCTDGGYYMIGLNKPQPDLFTNITWSTEHVARETLAAAEAAGLTVATLPLWYDADTIEDLLRMRDDLEAGRAFAPHTRLALAGLLPASLAHAKSVGL